MFQDWVSWDTLRDFAGFVVVLRMIVEVTNVYVDKWTGGRLPTFWYAYGVSLVLLTSVSIYSRTYSPGVLFLNVINGFIVTILAGKPMDLDEKKG